MATNDAARVEAAGRLHVARGSSPLPSHARARRALGASEAAARRALAQPTAPWRGRGARASLPEPVTLSPCPRTQTARPRPPPRVRQRGGGFASLCGAWPDLSAARCRLLLGGTGPRRRQTLFLRLSLSSRAPLPSYLLRFPLGFPLLPPAVRGAGERRQS
eukprot:scaffold931_cov383-Prasinococcus_capsulatus_cf.AAC.25